MVPYQEYSCAGTSMHSNLTLSTQEPTIIVYDVDGGKALGYNDGRVGTGEEKSEVLYLLFQSKVIVEWNIGTLLYCIAATEGDGPGTTSEVQIETSWRGKGENVRRTDRIRGEKEAGGEWFEE